jgi:8-oxo-dGTP pyrophosphatase MutT (NUDIX family)
MTAITMRAHGVTWLLMRGGRVMLERCPKKRAVLGVGEWFVPGGKIEGDESETNALVREVREEWNVKIKAAIELPLVEGSAVPPGPKGLFLMRPFVIDIVGDPPYMSGDGVELRWHPIHDALRSPVIQVRMMIAAAMLVHATARAEEEAWTRAERSARATSGRSDHEPGAILRTLPVPLSVPGGPSATVDALRTAAPRRDMVPVEQERGAFVDDGVRSARWWIDPAQDRTRETY